MAMMEYYDIEKGCPDIGMKRILTFYICQSRYKTADSIRLDSISASGALAYDTVKVLGEAFKSILAKNPFHFKASGRASSGMASIGCNMTSKAHQQVWSS